MSQLSKRDLLGGAVAGSALILPVPAKATVEPDTKPDNLVLHYGDSFMCKAELAVEVAYLINLAEGILNLNPLIWCKEQVSQILMDYMQGEIDIKSAIAKLEGF